MNTAKHGAVRLDCEGLYKCIKGKKIALMMNTTALDNEGRLLIDTVTRTPDVDVAFFFGMEHGVRGNLYAADGKLPDTDKKTGIRIVNLYDFPGLCPPVEWVEQVDAVVFSAQDVGVRHWTYTPWMMLLINACAKANREVIVLDRPNPIRGDIVEGAPTEEKYATAHLLSGFEYPLRHGMTIGELALMYNETKNVHAKLTVLKMKGWTRDMWYDETGLVWVPGSPNMPFAETPLYFATTGLLQSSNFSIGIGTTTPFQFVGAPDFDGDALTDALNALRLPGILFVQKYYMAQTEENPEKGLSRPHVLCNGTFLVIRDRNSVRPVDTQFHIMETVARLFPQAKHEYSIASCRMGTDRICENLKKGESVLPIMEEWQTSAEKFKRTRAPYLLY